MAATRVNGHVGRCYRVQDMLAVFIHKLGQDTLQNHDRAGKRTRQLDPCLIHGLSLCLGASASLMLTPPCLLVEDSACQA